MTVDYILLKNRQILKKEKLYWYHTKINRVDVMSMRNSMKVETHEEKKKFVRKFENCYLIPLSIDGIRSYFY